MRFLINIPKEFEQHFQEDRFEDSLHRLSADAHLLAGNYEQETAVMLIEAFAKAVPVPEHGRLIDADVVFKRLQKQAMSVWGNGNPRYQIVLEVMDAIRFAPTIIPAEEGE